MQPFGPRPDTLPDVAPPELDEARPLPFQWSLLAWAALVGGLTGLAVVGFHELLGLINNGLFGPAVSWALALVGQTQPEPPVLPVDPLPVDSGTPLRALLQIGLGGVGFLPDPTPLPPDPTPAITGGLPLWLASWPVVLMPVLGGLGVGLLRPIQSLALQQFLEGKGLQGLLQILISEEGARQQQVLPQGSREDPSVFRQEGHRLTQLPQGDLAQIRAVQGDHAAAWGDLGIDQTQNRRRA